MTGNIRYTAVLRQLPSRNVSQAQPVCYPLSFTEAVLLGRDPRCQIVLPPDHYRSVSRRHAEIIPVFGFESADGTRLWQICDLESANGTFINGQRLQKCEVLQSGDQIMLGQNGPEFVFEYRPTPASLPEAQLPLGISAAAAYPTAPSRIAAQGSEPAEAERITLTHLFPILSTGQHLIHKAYLLPGIITVGFVVSLFLSVGQSILFNWLLSAYLAGAALYFIYRLCGKHKPWWVLAGSALCTAAIVVSPIANFFMVVFRQWLPGEIPEDTVHLPFFALLVRMFFGAGLMEELLKAIPVLIAYCLGRCLRSPLRERLGVLEPLDGILLGAASAVGFTLIETLGQYAPRIYQSTLMGGGEYAAQLASLQLLIPRVLGSVAGHMAYSGYLGYFIGLSVLRPQQGWLILGVGYLSASGMHALWNATGSIDRVGSVILALVGILSYAFLGAAILKARELSPTRKDNFATRFFR